MDDKLRSRKWMLALLIFAATTSLAGVKILDGAQVMGIYMTLFGAYTVANVLEKKKLDD